MRMSSFPMPAADKARVAPLVAALEAQGWSVWWDPEIEAGQQFDDQIEAELDAAKAVLVLDAHLGGFALVRGEARERRPRVLVPPDLTRAPADGVRAIHTTDLRRLGEDPASAPFQGLLKALAR